MRYPVILKHATIGLSLALGAAIAGQLEAETHTVHVGNGSVTDLAAALEEATARPPSDMTVIVLGGTFTLPVGQGVPVISRGDISIEGGASAAVITAETGWEGPLFDIREDARLRLSNLEFDNIKLEPPELISNRGELEIRQVQFRTNIAYTFCFNFGRCSSVAGRIITNFESGRLTMDAVSFNNSGAGGNFIDRTSFGALLRNLGEASLSNVQLYLISYLPAAPFHNEGTLRIVNGSFFSRDWGSAPPQWGLVSGPSMVGNSVVVGFQPGWCADVESLGHNIVANPDCVLTGQDDLTGVQADLIWAPVEARWNPQGRELLTHALEPLAGSVAVDSGAPEYCTSGSLVGPARVALDGDGDGVTGCDRGAVERVPATLARGGINGLYYNPRSDGHYVYIAETTYTTMVMWTTFDSQGRQAWVFGIGDDVSGNGRLVTQAWINRDGAVRPDGTLRPADAVPWGTLEVRMQSCNEGRLIFDSDQPGFGSGEFAMQRLATVDQLECVEGR